MISKKLRKPREQRLKTFLVPKLRRISRMWTDKIEARKLARREVEIGKTKKGAPKFKVMYECQKCFKLKDKHETQMDHIDPVVGIKGFTNWEDYINRLFCGIENFMCLCEQCHSEKTLKENEQRKKNGKDKKRN